MPKTWKGDKEQQYTAADRQEHVILETQTSSCKLPLLGYVIKNGRGRKQHTSWKTADTRKAISNATACTKRKRILNLSKQRVQNHFKQQVSVLSYLHSPINWDLTDKYFYINILLNCQLKRTLWRSNIRGNYSVFSIKT